MERKRRGRKCEKRLREEDSEVRHTQRGDKKVREEVSLWVKRENLKERKKKGK